MENLANSHDDSLTAFRPLSSVQYEFHIVMSSTDCLSWLLVHVVHRTTLAPGGEHQVLQRTSARCWCSTTRKHTTMTTMTTHRHCEKQDKNNIKTLTLTAT